MGKYKYVIRINDRCSDPQKEFTISYGHTKNVVLCMEPGRAEIRYEMGVFKSADEIAHDGSPLFIHAMRKLYMVHFLTYGVPLRVSKLHVSVNAEQTVYDENSKGFPFVFSMLDRCENAVNVDWVCPRIIQSVFALPEDKKQRHGKEWEEPTIALEAYLLSNTRQFENDRFLNLWTSMNAVYNWLWTLEKGKGDVEWKKLNRFSRFIAAGISGKEPDPQTATLDQDELKKKQQVRNTMVAALRDIEFEEIPNIFRDTLRSMENRNWKAKRCERIFDIAKENNVKPFILLLVAYPYALRCNYFHGNLEQLVILHHKDPRLIELRTVNYFMDRFLRAFIPCMFAENGQPVQSIDDIKPDWITELKGVLQ